MNWSKTITTPMRKVQRPKKEIRRQMYLRSRPIQTISRVKLHSPNNNTFWRMIPKAKRSKHLLNHPRRSKFSRFFPTPINWEKVDKRKSCLKSNKSMNPSPTFKTCSTILITASRKSWSRAGSLKSKTSFTSLLKKITKIFPKVFY